MSDPAATARRRGRQLDVRRLLRRHGWTVGVYVLLFVLVLYWRSSTALPWGPFDVQSVAIDALPLAFAACGQAIAIISGGIDLSIGSLMSLVNVVAARWMVTMSLREAILVHAPDRPRRRARRRPHRDADRRDARRGHHRHALDAVRLGRARPSR